MNSWLQLLYDQSREKVRVFDLKIVYVHYTFLEELDSYLYQTVGQDAIEFVARALEVPLYRRVISGTAVEQGSEYGPRNLKRGIQGDETEDLLELLSTVKVYSQFQGIFSVILRAFEHLVASS